MTPRIQHVIQDVSIGLQLAELAHILDQHRPGEAVLIALAPHYFGKVWCEVSDVRDYDRSRLATAETLSGSQLFQELTHGGWAQSSTTSIYTESLRHFAKVEGGEVTWYAERVGVPAWVADRSSVESVLRQQELVQEELG